MFKKKGIIVVAGLMLTASTVSMAEVIHTRIGVDANTDIPHMGIFRGDHLFVDYSYQNNMPAINIHPNGADYRPTSADVQVSINSNNGFTSKSSSNPGYQSLNISFDSQDSPEGAPYYSRLDGGVIEYKDIWGGRITEQVTIEVAGLTTSSLQAAELIDISELISDGQGLGHITVAGQSLQINSIESCASNGCGEIPETKVQFDLLASGMGNGGFPQNTLVTFKLGYDTFTAPENTNLSSGSYSYKTTEISFSYTIPETGTLVSYEPGQYAQPSSIFVNEWEESPGVFVTDMVINISGISLEDNMGFTFTDDAIISMSLRGNASAAGQLPDLSKYEIQWGDIRVPGIMPGMSGDLMISKVSVSSVGGSDNGPSDTSNLLLSMNEEHQFPGPVYGSDVKFSVENPDYNTQYFNYSVEAVLPTGFTWPIETNNNNFNVSPGSKWEWMIPVIFGHQWPAGDYKVRVKLMTNEGLYATKEISVSHLK